MVPIILMAIGDFFYQWLLVTILLMVIDGYCIVGYWCLLMASILMLINAYSIGGYWCL
jgi:hypothetical protein